MGTFDVLNTGRGLVKMWTRGVQVSANAKDQLRNLADLPFIFRHVAAMPDVHWGMGSTVGSVIPTQGAIIPAAVGVDIGCGMCAALTNLSRHNVEDRLPELRAALERHIPHGRTDNGVVDTDLGGWGAARGRIAERGAKVAKGVWDKSLVADYLRIIDAAPRINSRGATWTHLGTLGSGNHFVELTLDELDRVWVFIHSGSRGPGARIGNYYMRAAKDLMKQFFIELDDPHLAYLPQNHPLFKEYMFALNWAQRYAKYNRGIMLRSAVAALCGAFSWVVTEEVIDCHHNYAAFERHFGQNVIVTRKGATRAGVGELGLIPGSMGARSYVVRGKGNRDSFMSCSHGAGRVMGRKQAMRTLTVEQHVADTAGVECRKDESVLDESPACYKDIDAVMAAQADLVEPIHTLKAVVCVKG